MSEIPWYPFYIGDYQQKTAHLSLLEHGAYRLLLDHYYATRSPLPNDDKMLFRICRANTPAERKAVLRVKQDFFTISERCIFNKRCSSEVDKLLKYSERQSATAQRRHSRGNATAMPRARVPHSDSDTEKKEKVVGTRFALQDPPPEWIQFCQTQRSDLDPGSTFDGFRDYWIAKPGKDGIKLDWFATWRNWIRNQKSQTKGQSYAKPTKIDLIARGIAEARAKREQREHGSPG